MPVEKTEKDISSLGKQVSNGEVRVTEIQRVYVWKPAQVGRLIESLYRGYPSSSLLFWRPLETPEMRAVAANARAAAPAVPPLYLLDGRQRITSLHRVMTDHPHAQIVFDVETDAFQNQSAATSKDARWVKVYELFRDDGCRRGCQNFHRSRPSWPAIGGPPRERHHRNRARPVPGHRDSCGLESRRGARAGGRVAVVSGADVARHPVWDGPRRGFPVTASE